MKYILLSFDLEEFDLPRDYNVNIKDDKMFKISYDGCNKILDILQKNNISATFFVSAIFVKKYPTLIKEISKNHEIALHCYEHKYNYENESFEKLKEGKKVIEKIINKKIKGFRAPKFQKPNYKILNQLNIEYDSSSHPTYIPGKYNNFFDSRKIKTKEGIKIIPVSVSPLLRLPLFWIVFRNIPLIYSKLITKSCLINDNYVCLIFHPWDFIDLNDFKIPFFIKKNTGNRLELKLNKYIKWCLEKNLTFITFSDYLSKNFK